MMEDDRADEDAVKRCRGKGEDDGSDYRELLGMIPFHGSIVSTLSRPKSAAPVLYIYLYINIYDIYIRYAII